MLLHVFLLYTYFWNKEIKKTFKLSYFFQVVVGQNDKISVFRLLERLDSQMEIVFKI